MRKFNRSVALAAVVTVAGIGSTAMAAPTVDGTLDTGLYTRFATQTVGTQFGDNQSELDAGYYRVEAGRLYLFLAGNLESNNNHLALFFDTREGGQNVIRTDNPDVDFNTLNTRYNGFTFDAGFAPDYYLDINRGNDTSDGANSQANSQLYANFSELNTNGGGVGGFLGSFAVPTNVPSANQQGAGTVGGAGGLPTVNIGYNDANVGGVDGTTAAADPALANAVTTGSEFGIDLAALGITGDFKLSALINGGGSGYLSNQALGGFAPGQGNLGSDGAGNFVAPGGVGAINLNNFAGDQFVSLPVTLTTYAYNVNADGNYSNPANFSPAGVPTGADGRVLFGNVITAPRTVTIDQDISLISLTFDNANAYTLAGTNRISIAGNSATAAVRVLQGNHVISAPVAIVNDTRVDVATGSQLSLTGAVTAGPDLNGGYRNLFKQGGGTLSMPGTRLNSITVNAGTLRTTGNGNTLVRGVTIDTGAKLDLTGTALIVDYDENFSPRDAIKAAIADGRLASSTLTGSEYGIGFLDSAADPALVAYNEAPLDPTSLVFRATFKGDADLNRQVGFSDLVTLAQNYNGTDRQWYQGDFDNDGTVSFTDLVSLAQNYNKSVPSMAAISESFGAEFAADWARAQSLVPEPTSLAALIAATGLLRRRRN